MPVKAPAQDGAAAGALGADVLQLPPGAAHGTVLCEDWADLRAQRTRLDAGITSWLAAMPPDFPLRTMRYANTKGIQRDHPMWMALTHLFNHQTHHRGQAHALIPQAGGRPAATDLPWIIDLKALGQAMAERKAELQQDLDQQ